MQKVMLSIFCRWPEPGKAKTRLIPDFGAEGAAQIYRLLLEKTICAARASGLPFTLRITGADAPTFRGAFGDDLDCIDQGEGDLTARLSRISPPAIIIGSDCPGLTAQHLRLANQALKTGEAVIGPAKDGGYYLIGLGSNRPGSHGHGSRDCGSGDCGASDRGASDRGASESRQNGLDGSAHFAFANMPWSTDAVYGETMRRFTARGMTPAILPQLSDVDTADDLKDWPEFLP